MKIKNKFNKNLNFILALNLFSIYTLQALPIGEEDMCKYKISDNQYLKDLALQAEKLKEQIDMFKQCADKLNQLQQHTIAETRFVGQKFKRPYENEDLDTKRQKTTRG